jgi:adenylate cyclase class 2
MQSRSEDAGHEQEIKLRMEGAEQARRVVAGLGASLKTARHLEDNLLFDDDERSLLARGCVLRLRQTPHASHMTFKGPRDIIEGIKSRQEVEFTVGDFEKAQSLLEGLGYRKVFRYQKYREAYQWRDAEIVVDETPVGVFLEIEGSTGTIHAAAEALGRSPADYINESYAALFVAAGKTGDMVF